jgi:hypothetical protein
MRFSEQHQINRPEGSDWFDANVEMDKPLYVDPFLLFEDEDRAWEGAHDEIVDFFDATLELLKEAPGHRESMHWAKAHPLDARSRLRKPQVRPRVGATPRPDKVGGRAKRPPRVGLGFVPGSYRTAGPGQLLRDPLR